MTPIYLIVVTARRPSSSGSGTDLSTYALIYAGEIDAARGWALRTLEVSLPRSAGWGDYHVFVQPPLSEDDRRKLMEDLSR